MNRGILFSDNGMPRDVNSYDSRKKKLLVSTDQNPKHIDVLSLNGGTRAKYTSDGSFTYKKVLDEIILTIEHKMPFTPVVLRSSYITEVTPATGSTPFVVVGSYYPGTFYLIANAFGYGEEGIIISVDAQYITIRHVAYSWNSGDFYTIGSGCKFNFRYMVTNQPDITSTVV